MTHDATLPANANRKPADVVPGPKRFCLTPVTRSANTRWTFAVRYYNAKGRQIEEEHSADTSVEIENRKITVVCRLRSKGMILCDCGCDFMTIIPET